MDGNLRGETSVGRIVAHHNGGIGVHIVGNIETEIGEIEVYNNVEEGVRIEENNTRRRPDEAGGLLSVLKKFRWWVASVLGSVVSSVIVYFLGF